MAYSELFSLSNYSFLKAASHPEEMVYEAERLGYDAIAITDECSLAGVVKAHSAAKSLDIELIIGSSFSIKYRGIDLCLVLLAPNRQAYAQISTLISRARRRSTKGTYELTLDDLVTGLKDCLLIWHIESVSSIHYQVAELLQKAFPAGVWLGISYQYQAQFQQHYKNLLQLSNEYQLPMCAVGYSIMHSPDRQSLLDVMSAIRLGCTVEELGFSASPNRERCLRPLHQIEHFYPPALIQQTQRIAEKCNFSLEELRYDYPSELVPTHETPSNWLRKLTEFGISARWPKGAKPTVLKQIKHELTVIKELDYEHYFLTVHDIVQFARDRGILCQGRGSAANSAVCYCLFITEVDPAQSNLLFERFISKERNEPPDIDVDFEHHRREEVIQYIYRKYGRERAALAATVISYRPKSAIRDVGKAIGLDQIIIDRVIKTLAWWDRSDDLERRLAEAELSISSPITQHYSRLIKEIIGMPRHLSQHVGGFIITQSPISSLVPTENAAMPERTIIQWDKDDIEALGLLKIDVLALGMLSAIQKSLLAINSYHQQPITLSDIPKDCSQTYDMLCRGDSVGVFQVESRAQMNMLPRLQPRCFYDLVIQVAIVRPGPIQGDMVHPFLQRRQRLEAVKYPNEKIAEVLERTLGVPIFQEQVIKLAMVAAGFTGGQADQLRRAMASWKKNGELMKFKTPVIEGMLKQGHSLEFAERLFRQMQGFGEYGFPESHAASFALLVYISAWLKCHHPAAFFCGLLNSQPMGFYSPSQLLQDAQRHGVPIAPVCINMSHYDYRLELTKGSTSKSPPILRVGLRQIKGIKASTVDSLIAARELTPFSDAADVKARCTIEQQQIELLISGGAFLPLSQSRFHSHWAIQGVHAEVIGEQNIDQSPVSLRTSNRWEDLVTSIQHTGISSEHPFALLLDDPLIKHCSLARESQQLQHGRWVQVAGIVTCRQRPATASGILFITLEDHTGNHNIVVPKNVQERCRRALLTAKMLHIKGVIERADPAPIAAGTPTTPVIHIKAGHIEDISQKLPTAHYSRDFH